jgi:hypothetical protein
MVPAGKGELTMFSRVFVAADLSDASGEVVSSLRALRAERLSGRA